MTFEEAQEIMRIDEVDFLEDNDGRSMLLKRVYFLESEVVKLNNEVDRLRNILMEQAATEDEIAIIGDLKERFGS